MDLFRVFGGKQKSWLSKNVENIGVKNANIKNNFKKLKNDEKLWDIENL